MLKQPRKSSNEACPYLPQIHRLPLNFLSMPDNHLDLLHSIEKFGSLSFNKVNFLNPEAEEATLAMTGRNLISLVDISSKITTNFPTLPSPSPENSPIHSSIGVSSPLTVTRISNPPISQPSISSPPQLSPLSNPDLSDLSLPPCVPPTQSPSPSSVNKKNVEGLLCVAKPSVATETLQQSLDFACGEGGANCYPDKTMAHASYAFNSYWQKTRRNGGTCSFGGTAMLITTDPKHCRFVLT